MYNVSSEQALRYGISRCVQNLSFQNTILIIVENLKHTQNHRQKSSIALQRTQILSQSEECKHSLLSSPSRALPLYQHLRKHFILSPSVNGHHMPIRCLSTLTPRFLSMNLPDPAFY